MSDLGNTGCTSSKPLSAAANLTVRAIFYIIINIYIYIYIIYKHRLPPPA